MCVSRFESLILPNHSRFTCACSKEDMNDDDGDDVCVCEGDGIQPRE